MNIENSAIRRLRLWAWKLIAALIFLKVLARKWVPPINASTSRERTADRKYPPDAEIEQLQLSFAAIDRNTAYDAFKKANPDLYPLMLCKLKNIRIRMDANRNHKRPHIHIDYKEMYHTASYAIDTGERLAGSLGTQYDQAVRRWIGGRRLKLVELWYVLQDGHRPDTILYELREQDQLVHY